eukprot:4972398-Ditylum_brightwellii.AAC.1
MALLMDLFVSDAMIHAMAHETDLFLSNDLTCVMLHAMAHKMDLSESDAIVHVMMLLKDLFVNDVMAHWMGL